MTGRDFARTLVSGVETSQVDTYINRVDALPTDLADAQVNV